MTGSGDTGAGRLADELAEQPTGAVLETEFCFTAAYMLATVITEQIIYETMAERDALLNPNKKPWCEHAQHSLLNQYLIYIHIIFRGLINMCCQSPHITSK